MERVKSKLLRVLFLVSFLVFSISAFAETYRFRTVSYAENIYNYNTQRWTGWSSWQKSNMLLIMDTTNGVVTIYSPVTQIYKIYASEESYYDSDGDLHMPFKFVDQDFDRGTIKLLQRKSGSSEVYIEFANVRWCYRVIRL